VKRLLAIALLVSACGSTVQPATPATVVAPSAAAAVNPATPTPTAAPNPSPTVTPAPTPTTKDLAAAYLKAATIANKADDNALAAYTKSPKTLTYAKRYDAAVAKSSLVFIRTIQAIPWTPEFMPIARRLISCDNQTYVYAVIASKDKDSLSESTDWNKANAQSAKCSAIANELRLGLGLPPVPIK
jgi:hypothetical protein